MGRGSMSTLGELTIPILEHPVAPGTWVLSHPSGSFSLIDQTAARIRGSLGSAGCVSALTVGKEAGSAVRGFAWNDIDGLVRGAIGIDEHGHRQRFLELIAQSRQPQRPGS